jgi:hypothetical protein
VLWQRASQRTRAIGILVDHARRVVAEPESEVARKG